MNLSAWDMFIDVGFIALLLLVGTIIRAKVRWVQNLFLPASIIAGILALALGPNGIGIIPFTDQIGTYPGILIAVIFGALPIATQNVKWKEIAGRVGSMWSYSQMIMLAMWGIGLLFGLLILNNVWGDLNLGFGLLLAAGFVGGHGTAAAVGDAFAKQGWDDALSLAMTSATVGVICSIVVGLAFIKYYSKKGQTNYITRFEDLPSELRTGLVPEAKRKSSKPDTVSSIAIDPLVLHLSLVVAIALGGYYLSELGQSFLPDVTIPAFSLAFLVGLAVKSIMVKTKSDQYIDKDTVNRISGSSTDLLVAFGIASISLSAVASYLVPLLLLLVFGLLFAWFVFRVLSGKFFGNIWFERGIFTWGWITGTMAMGIALLRIADPEGESKTLDDYALAYIPVAPVEIAIVTFAPVMIATGQHWLFVVITLGISIGLYLLAVAKGWVQPKSGKVGSSSTEEIGSK
ncbi:sodium/glutamate symporter [Bacillus sp. CGMCC 1.16541]|uniref:sodium/glutamate symporter n=1 Tax=Bacillus sp. CGMCC 1.16541 TaxID=2185143 RepID=UPI000D73F5F5|nr:sodium/glutamate symporter [Bacillus sp. CGMCC 1.16541]